MAPLQYYSTISKIDQQTPIYRTAQSQYAYRFLDYDTIIVNFQLSIVNSYGGAFYGRVLHERCRE